MNPVHGLAQFYTCWT